MKIIKTAYKELPLELNISFEAIFEYLEKIALDKDNFMYSTAIQLLEEYKKYPILRDGFTDFNYLTTYSKEINKLLDMLFPELLSTNEIKAATLPFEFTMFKLSKRFETILENAGEDYELSLRNYDESNLYIMSCLFILGYCYDQPIDFNRPFYFDIPNVKTGVIRHYRSMYNADFFKIRPLKSAPKISDKEIKLLLDNYNDISVWKKLFPIKSYEFKGFGMVNLFDVTSDQLISNLKEYLINRDHESEENVSKSISHLLGFKSIQFEFSTYIFQENDVMYRYYERQNSFIIPERNDFNCAGHFCHSILDSVFKKKEMLAISDIDEYGIHTNFNGFYKTLKKQGIQSILLVPLELNRGIIGVMELVSKNKYELNSINANKLLDIIPLFKIAAERYMEEFENKLESVIQEYYTSIHPTVKWKFYKAAREHIAKLELDKNHKSNLKSIVFEDVIPLYGQSDIKASSIIRNGAVQKDLAKQLHLASEIIVKAKKIFNLPIYNDLLYRIEKHKKTIETRLDSGDEVTLTYFLRNDIYPVFNHLKTLDKSLKNEIDKYMEQIDNKLQVIYEERKKYEESMNSLNEELANFIDKKQIEAQKMFPHYFERYKTDGVSHNMYIGQTMVQNHTYNELYLFNLRLWQLEMMCEMELIAHQLKSKMNYPLEIASLILVHSSPLTIKFRMDEKHFDVDGAYNIRYEIIKKRIDKVHIKNTKERLTQPGKIAIVYNQSEDAEEYNKYIKHLQSKNILLPEIEQLQLEDLQGTTGLNALRVTINYKNMEQSKTLDNVMKILNK